MKRIILSALLAVAVAGSACAQDQQPRREGFGRHQYGFQQLNLTDEQKTEMKTINEGFKKQLTELQKNEDITVREWKSRMKNIREEHKTKVQSVLTPEQKASMEKMRQDHKQKGHKRGKHGADFKKNLNLTPDQEAKMKQQRTESMQKMKAIKEDKNLTDDQKKVEIKKFREQQHQSFKSILTEEQIKKLDQQKSRRQKPVL